MKNQEEQLDNFFRENIGQYEETPSANAWDSVEKNLPAQKRSHSYWVAASIAVVLFSFTVLWSNVLKRTPSFNYETAANTLNVSHPQKEFIPIPFIIHSTTIVYVEKEVKVETAIEESIPTTAILASSYDIKPISNSYAMNSNISSTKPVEVIYSENEPITIIYKKGDAKHPKLAKAASYLKQVGEGERPLINFEKISTGLLARRETFNNSNK